MLYMHVDIFLRCLPPLSLAIPSNHPVYNVNMEPIIRKQSCMICMYIYIYTRIYMLYQPTWLTIQNNNSYIFGAKQNLSCWFPLFFPLFEIPGSLKVREVMSGDPVVWEALGFGVFLAGRFPGRNQTWFVYVCCPS